MASPIYQQIAGTLRHRVNSGKYAEGDQIPALEKLTEEFGVSRMTVIKAIDSIEAQGYVQRFQGRGTFVNSVPETIHTLADFTADEIELGVGERTSKMTACHIWQGKPPELEQQYRAPKSYQYLARTMFLEGCPYHIAEYFIDEEVYRLRDEGYWQQQAIGSAIPDMEEFAPATIRQIIKVGAADIDEAKVLELDLNTPILNARRIFTTGVSGRLLCLARLIFRVDMVRFDISIECSTKGAVDNIRGRVIPDRTQRKS